jgi:hypothetical protein
METKRLRLKVEVLDGITDRMTERGRHGGYQLSVTGRTALRRPA